MTDKQTFTDLTGAQQDFAAAAELMDIDLRAVCSGLYAPCSAQDFIDQYNTMHFDRYGQDFEPYASGSTGQESDRLSSLDTGGESCGRPVLAIRNNRNRIIGQIVYECGRWQILNGFDTLPFCMTLHLTVDRSVSILERRLKSQFATE